MAFLNKRKQLTDAGAKIGELSTK